MTHRVTVCFLSVFSLLSVSNCASKAENAQKVLAQGTVSPTPALALAAASAENPALSNNAANTQSSERVSFKGKDSASSLYFINQRSGWVLLSDALYRTNDGGKSWVKLSNRTLRNYKKIIFATEQKGLVLQDEWNTEKRSNTVLSTEDGGRSWRPVLEMPTPIYAINFITDGTAYVSGRWQPIQYTDDGGRTWKQLDSDEGLNYLYFINRKVGWGYGGAIWHTEDGGETWAQVIPYQRVADLWDAKFINALNGWIIGAGRQVWHTTDGKTWELSTALPVSKSEFTTFDFISSSEGWIASEDGAVIRTTDGGNTWHVVANVENSLRTIKFIDRLNGWAASRDGKLFNTTDGGTTWAVVRL
jgi:photosystem II stability/assembly factor-like uncharacterized protein